jgi:ABC-type sugar transport system ATPase subunit
MSSLDLKQAVLEIKDVRKHFGGISALTRASMTLHRGTVLALVGENGAGKSTLIKIISGAVKRDGGEVLIGGKPVEFASPLDATERGVGTVYQELSLLLDLSVAENLVMGTYPRRRGFISWAKARREAEAFVGELGLKLRITAPVSELSLAERYMVEIAKAVQHRPKILILDEPTAALDHHDAEQIFLLVEELCRSGTAVIFVSHRLSEIYRCAQRYVVLKDGESVAEGLLADTSQDELVGLMLGSELASSQGTTDRQQQDYSQRRVAAKAPRRSAGPGLRVQDMATLAIRNVTFEADCGEVVGIAGLRGSGQTHLCRALAGAERLTAGRMELRGKVIHPRSPSHAWKLGIGHLPLDRKTQGLFMNMTAGENVAMSWMITTHPRWISKRRQQAIAAEYKRQLDIRLPGGSLDTPVSDLSGGNQQKVVIGRCLAARPSVLILDDPTRGVDVGAKQQIHELIAAMAADGLCVIVSSSEVSELLGLCNKVIVLHRGEMTGLLQGPELDEHNIVRHASGL